MPTIDDNPPNASLGAGAATPHDAFVKAMFGDRPAIMAAYLRQAMPSDLRELYDLDGLELLPTSVVNPQLRELHADLVFRVPATSAPHEDAEDSEDTEDALVLVLLEHQSTVDRTMPLRLSEYRNRLWRRHLDEGSSGAWRLPPIFTTVLYTGPGRWTAPRSLLEMVEAENPNIQARFRPWTDTSGYHLLEVGDWADDGAEEAGLRGTLWALQLVRRRLDRLAMEAIVVAAAELLQAVIAAHGGRTGAFIFNYLLITTPLRGKELTMAMQTGRVPEEVQKVARTGAEVLMEEGMALVLLSQLGSRFGPLDDATRQKVEGARRPQLERWAHRILTATTLEEVLIETSPVEH